MPRRQGDAQQFTLLIATVVAVAAACSGFDRGWAYGHDAAYAPGEKSAFKPTIDLQVRLGWWNATTSMSTQWIPTGIDIQGDSAKGLGAFTCILLGLSGVLALSLLASSLLDAKYYPAHLVMDRRTENLCLWTVAGLVLFTSLALYGGLAFGANHELNKQFGRGLLCVPDWAFYFAAVSAICWAALAYVTQSAAEAQSGYLPF